MTSRGESYEPIRTCIGCRAQRAQSELVRCVLAADGRARVDRRAPGRGAYVCGADCLDLAIRRRAFDRAWRRSVPPAALDALRADLSGSVVPQRPRQDTN